MDDVIKGPKAVDLLGTSLAALKAQAEEEVGLLDIFLQEIYMHSVNSKSFYFTYFWYLRLSQFDRHNSKQVVDDTILPSKMIADVL